MNPLKTLALITLTGCLAAASHAQTLTINQGQPGMNPVSQADAKEPVNYLIRVEWKEPKGEPKSLEVLTAEGNVEFSGLQKNSVKLNDNEVPVTLKLTGNLSALNEKKGRLTLFLGRTVPYVTGNSGSGPAARASYAQMSVGLSSTLIVKFGKPAVIQSDENEEITVLVKRVED